MYVVSVCVCVCICNCLLVHSPCILLLTPARSSFGHLHFDAFVVVLQLNTKVNQLGKCVKNKVHFPREFPPHFSTPLHCLPVCRLSFIGVRQVGKLKDYVSGVA